VAKLSLLLQTKLNDARLSPKQKIIINVENTKATNTPYTRLFAKVLNPYDKIHQEKPVLKDFGNIKDCSVTRMKQNKKSWQIMGHVRTNQV